MPVDTEHVEFDRVRRTASPKVSTLSESERRETASSGNGTRAAFRGPELQRIQTLQEKTMTTRFSVRRIKATTGTIVCLVCALAFVLPAYAVDVNQLQYMPSITLTSQLPSGLGLGGSSAPPFPLSPTFGVTPGPATFGVCPDNLLLTGLKIHFDQTALFKTGGVTNL